MASSGNTSDRLAEVGVILALGFLRLRSDSAVSANESDDNASLTPSSPSNCLDLATDPRHRCNATTAATHSTKRS